MSNNKRKEAILAAVGKLTGIVTELEKLMSTLSDQFMQAKSADDRERIGSLPYEINHLQLMISSSNVLRSALLQDNLSECFTAALKLLIALLWKSNLATAANIAMQLEEVAVLSCEI